MVILSRKPKHKPSSGVLCVCVFCVLFLGTALFHLYIIVHLSMELLHILIKMKLIALPQLPELWRYLENEVSYNLLNQAMSHHYTIHTLTILFWLRKDKRSNICFYKILNNIVHSPVIKPTIYYSIWLHALDLPFQDSSGIAEEWRVQVIKFCIYFHSFIF